MMQGQWWRGEKEVDGMGEGYEEGALLQQPIRNNIGAARLSV